MGEAKVILSEVDNSNYISSDGQVYAAICLYTPKGDATKPTLVTNINQLYSRYIGSDKFPLGCDVGLYTARKFLEMGSNLWVSRVCTDDDTMGAAFVPFDSTAVSNFALHPVADSGGNITPIHSAEDVNALIADDATGIAVFSVNPGAWGSNLVVDIVKPVEATKDHDFGTDGKVADVADATWGVNVYEFSETTGKIAETSVVPVTVTVFEGSKSTLCNITQGTTSYKAAVSDCYLKKLSGGGYELYLDKDCTAKISAINSNTKVNIESRTNDYTALDNHNAYIITVKDSKGNILERAAVSNNREARDGFGTSIFAETVFANSAYIGVHVPVSAPIKLNNTVRGIKLTTAKGGTMLSAESSKNLTSAKLKAIRQFRDKDSFPVKVILDGGCTDVAYKKALVDLASERKDCVAILSTLPEDEKSQDPLSAILNFRNNVLNANSSYGALFTPHVKTFDEDTASYVMVPPDAYYAGLLSRTAETSEIWFPVAGLNRGVLDSALDVQVRFTDSERDLLVDNQVNPIRFYPGQGVVIWGNETLRTVASATQSLHVRMLLSTIEPAMAKALEGLLFEMNDDMTRDTARMMLDSFLDDVLARRGIDSKTVVCDTKTNNMPVDIDNNRMIVDVYITPTGYVKTIKLNVTVQSHSISISDEG